MIRLIDFVKKGLFVFLVAGLLNSLTASAQTSNLLEAAPPVDSLQGLSLDAYYKQHLADFKRWQAAGLHWFIIGDNLVFVLPANDFYRDIDHGVVLQNKAILSALAQWVRPVPKSWVRLLAFRDSMSDEPADRALAVQDAKALAQYFGDQGIDARMIYTNGFVETVSNPLDSTVRSQTSRPNRIEMVISLLPIGTALR